MRISPELQGGLYPYLLYPFKQVVLSTCQTGVGGIFGNGEEILGLGYQMQQAGALATIASLWVVDDEGTQVLMDAFYRALRRGSRKVEALRQVQTTLINSKFNHPFYGAPMAGVRAGETRMPRVSSLSTVSTQNNQSLNQLNRMRGLAQWQNDDVAKVPELS